MTMPDDSGAHAAELRVARALAREAAELVMQLRGGDASLLAVEMKPGDEPVTVADRAASDLIVTGLLAAFPDDVVISEERADGRLTAALLVRRSDRWHQGLHPRPRGVRGDDRPVRRRRAGGRRGPPADHPPRVLGRGRRGVHRRRRRPAPPARGVGGAQARAIRLVTSKSHRSDAIDQVKALLGVTDELNIARSGSSCA